jgi:putative FmdB family regulatory protein
MPIYEYACQTCRREFELLVRNGGPAPECPECHGHALDRKLSAFAPPPSSAARPQALGPCATCGDPNGPCRMAG